MRKKQIFLIIFFIFLSGFLINFVSLRVVKDDLKSMIELVNWQTSGQVSEKLNNEIDRQYKLYKEIENLIETTEKSKISNHLKKMLLESESEVLYFSYFRNKNNFPDTYEYRFSHPQLIKEKKGDEVEKLINSLSSEIEKGFAGKKSLINISNEFQKPALFLILPSNDGFRVKNVFIAVIKAESLADSLLTEKIPEKTIAQKGFVSFVTDFSGNIILHPEVEKILNPSAYKENLAVKQMIQDKKDSNLIRFTENNKEFWGAYKRLDEIDLGVVTLVSSEKASASISSLHTRSTIVTIMVILAAVLFVYFLSDKIFKTNDEKVDENSSLTEEANDFIEETIKTPVISEPVSTRKIKSVVCLSAISSFSKITENMSAEDAVDLLSDFYAIFDSVILDKNGIVNKHVGNAVLSYWNLENSDKQAAKECIETALLTRKAVFEYNKKTGRRIKAALGISTGEILTGSIKVAEGFENTITGTPVKIAVKTEKLASSKGVDIIICSDTYELVKDDFICESAGKIKLKTAGESRILYAVLDAQDNEQAPQSIDELKERLNADV